MEKVTLSKTARKAFSERFGRAVPDPNSEAFDDLLEDLRELRPDDYTDLMGALEYNGDKLPVEKEAVRAYKRGQRQVVIDRLKNRQTHDNKRIPDKRKSLLLGLGVAGCLMGWMGYTNISRAYTSGSAAEAEESPVAHPVEHAENNENVFGVSTEGADLGAQLVAVVPSKQPEATVPTPPPRTTAPPRDPAPKPDTPDQTETRLPYGLGQPVAQTQEVPGGDLPPVPSPPQPGVASAFPASPYLHLPQAGGTNSAAATVLPGTLSFSSPEAVSNGTIDTLKAGSGEAGLPSAPGTTLVASSAEQSASLQNAPPPPRLGGVSREDAPPTASSLGWEDPQAEPTAVEETNLSFPQGAQAGGMDQNPANPSTQPLPPVPQVGDARPPPATPVVQAGAVENEPEVTNLNTLLTPGTQLEAALVTGVAAADGATTPVIAKTAGNWCGESSCPDITWIGEASYPSADRVELTFSQAVVADTAQGVTASAFGGDHLPGLPAGVRDVAPTALQDVLRGAVGGAADYLDALNTRETVVISGDEIIRQPAEPDLGTYLLGRGTNLFSLPSDQTSITRLAEIPPGTTFTVIFGL